MFHYPPRRVAALLSLSLGLAALHLQAQTPASILVLRLTEYTQTSAIAAPPTGYDFAAYVSFTSPPPTATSVTLQGPSGAPVAFERQPDGTYQFFAQEGSAAALAADYPDGTYTVSVSGGGKNSSTTVNVNTNAPTITPTLITNFDQLQALTNGNATITWAYGISPNPNDILTLTMTRPDGTDVPTFDPPNPQAVSVTEFVPQGVKITADLTYATLVTTALLNSGVTTFGSGAGFNLEFPIHYPFPLPSFSTQPQDTGAEAGSAAPFSASAANVTYQWYFNGALIPGATGATFHAGGTVADAGTYTVVASNESGSVTSNPAVLSVGTGLQVGDYAGTGTAGSADGPVASAQFNGPAQIAFDRAGNLFVVDSNNDTIREITPAGIVSTFAGQAGQIGSADGKGSAARFNQPSAIALDANGTLYVCDENNETIRKITADGSVTTLAGTAGQWGNTDGPRPAARFMAPAGIAVDAQGNVYVQDSGDGLRKITPAGGVTTLVRLDYTSGWKSEPLLIGPDGNLYTVNNVLQRLQFSAGAASWVAASDPAFYFNYASALATDGKGNWYESGFGSVEQITPDGFPTIIAGQDGSGFADGFGAQARFGTTYGMAMDATGTLYIADYDHNVIRKATVVPGTGSGITFAEQPQSHVIAAGSTFLLSETVAGGAVVHGIWEKDGAPLQADTLQQSPLVISNAKPSDAGTYTFVAANAAGATRSAAATITIDPNAIPGRITNLSIRSNAGTGPQTLIVGFSVSGTGTAKSLLLRGIGPGLVPYGVNSPLPDPILTVYQGQNPGQSNDDWDAALSPVFTSVGAFPLSPGSPDAALRASFAPGTYSVQITGKNATGIALAEIYDLDAIGSGLRLVNVSARTQVGTGNNVLIAGFAISGGSAKTVLLRGVGPTLHEYGVTGYLEAAQIELYSGQTKIASNSNWMLDYSVDNIGRSVGAFPLETPGTYSDDAAMLATLDPGTYSVIVRGVNDTTGVALVEVYEVP